MKAESIEVGDLLRLKPKRQQAYGAPSALVRVTAITPRKGYKTPWIRQGDEAYTPSDFERRVEPLIYG